MIKVNTRMLLIITQQTLFGLPVKKIKTGFLTFLF